MLCSRTDGLHAHEKVRTLRVAVCATVVFALASNCQREVHGSWCARVDRPARALDTSVARDTADDRAAHAHVVTRVREVALKLSDDQIGCTPSKHCQN